MNLSRLRRGLTQERRWAVMLLDQSLDDLLNGADPTGLLVHAPQHDRFWADPFPARDRLGNLWVFVEELERWRGLGSIVALRIEPGVGVVQRRTVLRSRHHFSFPQVHRWDGVWVATVESCDPMAHTYTFTDVGEPWLASLRTLPVGVIDPALAIPANGADWHLTGTSGSDYFAGYRQWRGEDGADWQEQVDLRFRDPVLARPAGNLDARRGLRSVQDCSDNYGIATSIITWQPESRGPGEVLRRLDGASFGRGAHGTHTLAWTPDGDTVVADVWQRGPQAFSGVHRVLEQRHGRFCAGRKASARMP
ncbi:MAG: hypothetical protein QG597_1036 [Actinomycetota bacterium]|nr:hypothetical protein [Actinomycetota bacterium]